MADADRERERDEDETGAESADAREERPTPTRIQNRLPRRRPLGEVEEPHERGPAAYLAEFIGTFALVFFVCVVVLLYVQQPVPEPTVPGQAAEEPFEDFAVVGLVHAFVLFMLIQTLAVVSGAHFNPAVTAAMTAIRQIRPIDAAIYVAMQLLGAIAAAFVVSRMFDNPFAAGGDPTWGGVAIGPAAAGSTTVALAAEIIGTFFLVWAIVGVAVNPRGLKDWAGFSIGATLGAAVMILGPASGGSFNPARAFGPALFGEFGEGAGTWILVWIIGPLIGALLAAFIYFQTVILPGRKGVEGMEPVG